VITDNLFRYERQCLQVPAVSECSFGEFEEDEIGGVAKLKFDAVPILHYPKIIL